MIWLADWVVTHTHETGGETVPSPTSSDRFSPDFLLPCERFGSQNLAPSGDNIELLETHCRDCLVVRMKEEWALSGRKSAGVKKTLIGSWPQ